MCALFTGYLLPSNAKEALNERSYNDGINIIPTPASLIRQEGQLSLKNNATYFASTPQAKTVADFFVAKLKTVTGFKFTAAKQASNATISVVVNSKLKMDDEGYKLEVTPNQVKIEAKTPHGAFYGLQTMMQLLPAEVEKGQLVKSISWNMPCVKIEDAPRFGYRGVMLDPCRHFIPVENIKKQLDVMALFKINKFHWHLTEDQGWRIEIKKYPKLTEIGSKRIEGEGHEYGGFYTQEQIKDIVAYASKRFITVVPELELPGHELAAIAAYPELSCKGETVKPRIIWGVEDIVMCPGKEKMFEFLEDVIKEMVPLFPGTYFHIGGDECPKTSWKSCPACQARIKSEGLVADKEHSAEERLQSYVIRRMEKVLNKYGKKIIGWDEILEGGLSPTATVMSWRGEEGGIAAATQNRDVIMTPGSGGLYLDHFQGDPKLGPVAIGGYATLEKTYSYNPIPKVLMENGKSNFIKGVQCNIWSEYMYNTDIMEYRMYPRLLALAEVAWSQLDRKDYTDFARRINNAYVRLDGHKINYHIPMPEQPNGSCNFVAFTDHASLTFTTTRPIKMVYTLDGSEPTAQSKEYVAPIELSNSALLKICSVLPSGKTSTVRTIKVEKQSLAPAKTADTSKSGLELKYTPGTFFNVDEVNNNAKSWNSKVIKKISDIRDQSKLVNKEFGKTDYAAVATGYVNIPEDGVYYFSSNNEEVWIDGKLLINNKGEVKRFSHNDSSMALAKGLHEIKVVFLSNIIGGWPSTWDDGNVLIRRADQTKFEPISSEQLHY